jgi:hypothetical protein
MTGVELDDVSSKRLNQALPYKAKQDSDFRRIRQKPSCFGVICGQTPSAAQ